MKKLFLLLLAVLAMAVGASAQTRTVTGTVVDATNDEPLTGVSVSAGHGVGVVTDIDGNFTIQVAANTTKLNISYVGFAPQTVTIGNSKLFVKLEPSTSALDEVIVVAYGTTKRSEYTGSAGVVAADQLENAQVSNVTKALTGKMAGVQTLSSNGQPGAGASVYIRGTGSINASTSPLYVVDGMPYDGDISNIPAGDIEQLTVMKDAASTALYGARGANGVIMITTKRGSEGNAKVTLDASWGSNGRSLPTYDIITNPGQYLEAMYRALYMQQIGLGYSASAANAFANQNLWLNSMQTMSVPAGQSFIGMDGKLNPAATYGYSDGNYYYTPENWIDNTFTHGLRQEYALTVTGGTSKLNYYVSGSYLSDTGIIDNSNFDRFSTRVNVDYQAKDWLKIGTSTNYVYTNSGYPAGQSSTNEGGTGNAFAVAYTIAPIYPFYVRDAQGNLMYDKASGRPIYDYGMGQDFGYGRMASRPSGGWATANPAGDLVYNVREFLSDVLDSKWYAILTPVKGLTVSGTAGLFIDNTRYHNMDNNLYGQSAAIGGAATQQHQRLSTLNLQGLVSYNLDINEAHNLDFMVGVESQDYREEYVNGSGKNLYMPGSWALSNTIDSWTISGGTASLAHRSIFGRVKYNFNDRYYATASVRSDASSRFHPDHRWGTFWSASFGWDINKEAFMKDQTWIDLLKFKASFGQNGNDNISTTQYINYTDFYSISGANGVWSDSELAYKGNPDITWEKSNNFNVGVDFSFWQGKLSGSAEYYLRQTSDMLFNLPTAPSLGYSSIPSNVGSMRNSGFELSLNYRAVNTKDITLEIFANATMPKNRVVSLDPSILNDEGSWERSSSQLVTPGKSLYTRWLVHYAGVDENGTAMYLAKRNVLDDMGNPIRIGGSDDNPVYQTEEYLTTNYTQAYNTNRKQTEDLLPNVYGGFGFNLEAYGFDLEVGLSYQLGGTIYDNSYQSYMNPGLTSSLGNTWHKDIFNSWTPDNTNTDVPRMGTSGEYVEYASSTSDRWLISSDYLALNSIKLGYTIPDRLVKKLGLNSLRVYFAAENVALISARRGLDPRQSFISSSTSNYSPIRTLTGGLRLSF
ncbi:MAG: TonB-dependent receptor [Muribaculaceae bacterium]|nr:TonB-dependent receptor [Muribaculaceae bacterium]